MFGNINEIKPDRIQFRPPTDGEVPWMEHAPSLTHTYDFDNFVHAALFGIYAEVVAQESDEIVVKQSLFGRSLSITVKPVSADYLPHAVYEFAAIIDAAIEGLRRNRFNGEPRLEDFDFADEDLDEDFEELDFDELDSDYDYED